MEKSLEYILTNSLKDEIIEYINSHQNKIEDLVKLVIKDSESQSSRAAWLLSKTIEKNDIRIKNYVPEIIEVLSISKDGKQRDLINVLSRIDLTEEEEGKLFDISVEIWCKLNKIPSVRYYAFRLILQIAKKYPELNDEVTLLSEDYYVDSLSNGIKKSIQRAIKEYRKEIEKI